MTGVRKNLLMNKAHKVILIVVLVIVSGSYWWGWTIRPHLRYELLTETNYDYCGFGPPTPPLSVLVTVDNVGDTALVTNVTLSAINATI